MSIEDDIAHAYMQTAYNRGGAYYMAMLMMAKRLLALEDKLLRAGIPFDEDTQVSEILRKERA